tara:strand:- start:2407 stop:2622 length:216 start_codon:yes stop_codon:yes gene_type:complete
MSDSKRQTGFVKQEWREKRDRRGNPKHPVGTDWQIVDAIEDESFDIADVHIDEDDAARMGSAAASWLEVYR